MGILLAKSRRGAIHGRVNSSRGEEFDALVFNAVHGYYRQAIGCLRNALEVMMVAAGFAVVPNKPLFEKWRNGKIIEFGQGYAWLRDSQAGAAIETAASPLRVFGEEAKDPDAWLSGLFGRLCGYAHSRSGYNNADFWESNGPIHVPHALDVVEAELRETLAACYLLLRIGWPALGRAAGIDEVLSKPSPSWVQYLPLLEGQL